MGELNREGVVAVPSLCGYLQDAASAHAATLGFGLGDLAAMGRTWMLSRLIVETTARLRWNETLVIETWPQGVRRNLIAIRDFIGCDGAGNVLLTATSEWLFIDTRAGRIARVPEYFSEFTPPGTPHVPIPDTPPPSLDPWDEAAAETITVRHSDIDVNQHVNNTRYADWLLEPLVDTKGCAQPMKIDILYKVAATDADTIRSCVSPEEDGLIRHRLARASDGVTLAVAVSQWR